MKLISIGKKPSHRLSYLAASLDMHGAFLIHDGRSLWFIKGAYVEAIVNTINGFSAERQADLWNGIGLGATYARGADEIALTHLVKLSNDFRPQLAQGAAFFAAKARERAGNPTHHTTQAGKILSATDAVAAARITDDALIDLPYDGPEPAYEIWRQRTQNHHNE